MLTAADVDALEERVTRMFPYIDLTAVNVIRRELKFLKEKVVEPCTACARKANEQVSK